MIDDMIWYMPSGSRLSKSEKASASLATASRLPSSAVSLSTSWHEIPIAWLYSFLPRFASLVSMAIVVAVENLDSFSGLERSDASMSTNTSSPGFALEGVRMTLEFGSSFSSAEGVVLLGDTRRNCRTVLGLLPKDMFTPRGCRGWALDSLFLLVLLPDCESVEPRRSGWYCCCFDSEILRMVSFVGLCSGPG